MCYCVIIVDKKWQRTWNWIKYDRKYIMCKAKSLSWNSGKPHGQNAHWIESLKQNLSPPTGHGNAPVSTHGLCLGTGTIYFVRLDFGFEQWVRKMAGKWRFCRLMLLKEKIELLLLVRLIHYGIGLTEFFLFVFDFHTALTNCVLIFLFFIDRYGTKDVSNARNVKWYAHFLSFLDRKSKAMIAQKSINSTNQSINQSMITVCLVLWFPNQSINQSINDNSLPCIMISQSINQSINQSIHHCISLYRVTINQSINH